MAVCAQPREVGCDGDPWNVPWPSPFVVSIPNLSDLKSPGQAWGLEGMQKPSAVGTRVLAQGAERSRTQSVQG